MRSVRTARSATKPRSRGHLHQVRHPWPDAKTVRRGLKFHDGGDVTMRDVVTTRDVVASLKRSSYAMARTSSAALALRPV